MSIKGYIIAFFLVCCSWALRAQDESHLYETALEAYELGMFEKVDTLLSKSVSSFNGESRIGVYRLLALSNLNMDRPAVAESWVARLLAVDPYYRVYNDVPRFTEMVNRLRAGKTATITTASQQAVHADPALPVEAVHGPGQERVRFLKETQLVSFLGGFEQMRIILRTDGP